jgi:hypothetical protein
MPTTVDCPACQRKLRLPEELAGKPVKCPTCGEVFQGDSAPPPLPAAATATAPPPVPQARLVDESAPMPIPRYDGAGLRPCPHCHEQIDVMATRCRFCGQSVDSGSLSGADFVSPFGPGGYRRDWQPHRGTLVLVLGILSLVFSLAGIVCYGYFVGFPLGLTAWILGHSDLGKMARNEMDPAGRNNTQAGMICGIIGTVLSALVLLACVGLIAFMVASGP